MYEQALEGIAGPQSSENAAIKDRMRVTYARVKDYSVQMPAFFVVGFIRSAPVLLSAAMPIVLSYMAFVTPVMYSAISLSHFVMLAHLLSVSYSSSRELNRDREKTVTKRKIVPVGTSGTNASSSAAASVHSKAASCANSATASSAT